MNPEPFIVAHFEGIMVGLGIVLTGFFGFLAWQSTIIHKRIDTHAKRFREEIDKAVADVKADIAEEKNKIDAHIKDGQEVLKSITRLETKHENGDHKH